MDMRRSAVPGTEAREKRRGRARKGPVAKRPFEIDQMMHRIREAVQPLPKAALFELAEDGHDSVFEQLAACIISIRTLDQITVPTARKLFAEARTPRQVVTLGAARVDELIRACTFHEPKSRTIVAIAEQALERYDGRIPCDAATLLSFRGVGPKCANLALGIACNDPQGIGVDIHVHRVTNRWGYVAATTPEKTMAALQQVLPKGYWLEINKLLVPFGKYICTGKAPRCSTCPVLAWCRQVGVREHR